MTEYLTVDEVASNLRRPRSTLYQWRHNGKGPPSVRIVGAVLYPKDQFEKWLKELSDDSR